MTLPLPPSQAKPKRPTTAIALVSRDVDDKKDKKEAPRPMTARAPKKEGQ